MHLTFIRENTDLVRIPARQNIAVLVVRCLSISLVNARVHGLGIAETVHQEHDICLLDLLLLHNRFL